jgi:proteic killer suppression protein
MIKSFRCKETEKIFKGFRSAKLPLHIQTSARTKLAALNAIVTIESLLHPLGNRLEALKGDRLGQYSIRINQQYRLCFQFAEGHAESVEIVDYH